MFRSLGVRVSSIYYVTHFLAIFDNKQVVINSRHSVTSDMKRIAATGTLLGHRDISRNRNVLRSDRGQEKNPTLFQLIAISYFFDFLKSNGVNLSPSLASKTILKTDL